MTSTSSLVGLGFFCCRPPAGLVGATGPAGRTMSIGSLRLFWGEFLGLPCDAGDKMDPGRRLI